ncbi:hypothetical protein DOTSEDRAFT_68902 [Dothistroma septosporum NZE10]|uniref:C2H2-type domain-containing protein n=1 Tax=Dothistroma septosporum (strain NZE10 / CBS 128990) TaxID=675120 RepID=N1Q565_DOTSN|nr:hypothetical protein DOTSEDRAFT_68902 [Dothistroma septosporum NZE10]
MSHDGSHVYLYQDQVFQNYHGMSSDTYNDGNQQHLLHRASDPLDLSQFHRNIDAATDLSIQNLTKPVNDTAWNSQRPSLPQQLYFNQFPWNYGGMATKAMTEPTPNQDICLFKSPHKSSDVSDSAYDSMPTSGGAVEDSYNANSSELMGGYFHADLKPHMVEPPAEMNIPRSVKSGGQFLAPPAHNNRRKQPVDRCRVPGCNKQPKNQSDATKHALTHSKPYRCGKTECNRKDGFATVNDLERHKKSVHKLLPRVGNPAGYICAACQVDAGGQRKFWPRRDNFKAHIKRKHASENEEHLLNMSQQIARPDDTQTADGLSACGAGFGSTRQSQVDPVEGQIHQHMSPLMGHPIPERDDDMVFDPDSTIGSQTDLVAFAGDHTNDAHGLFGDPSYELTSPGPFNANTFPFPSSGLRQLEPAQRDFVHSQQQHQRLPSIQVTTSSMYESQSTTSTCISQSSGGTSSSQGSFPCPYSNCNKVKSRECDLRKHTKRHTRPYGCTFPSCVKKFGSRNDWKRHESSQHQLIEQWKCSLCLSTQRPFPQLPALLSHLHTHHNLHPHSDIDIICASSHLGREGHRHFWCGFCRRLVKQGGLEPFGTGAGNGAGNAWDARFKHIGDHFDKDNMDSLDWVCVEEGRRKRDGSGWSSSSGSERERGMLEKDDGGEENLLEIVIEESDGEGLWEWSGNGNGKRRKVEGFGGEEEEDAHGESDHDMY